MPSGSRPVAGPRWAREFREAWDAELAKGDGASMIKLAKLIGNLPDDWPEEDQPPKE
ncbi:hypothetical protein [Rhodoplanes sp. SY1]|uniref:hypothetical protein n=1 Tax=Rhodoplanes sp. SY1 TaxID=3166646 RepID=UPI0038B537CE